MKDFDTALAETLHDAHWDLPVAPDAIDVIQTRARRIRHRRRAAATSGVVAAVLAITLGAVQLRSGDSSQVTSPTRSETLYRIPGLGNAPSGPVMLDGSVYIVKNNDEVVKVSLRTGQVVRTASTGLDPVHPQAPVEPGRATGTLFVSGGALWQLGEGKDHQFSVYRLDPRTLDVTLRVRLPSGFFLSMIATPGSFWAVTANGRTFVRMDGRTGAITSRLALTGKLPPGLDPATIRLISVDERAGAVWLTGLLPSGASALVAAKIDPGALAAAGWESIDDLSNGSGTAPGDDGSLWVGWAGPGRTIAHLAPQSSGNGLRRLPVGAFPAAEFAAAGRELGSAGERLWIALPNAAETSGTLVCLNRSTGEPLARYPLVGDHGRSIETALPQSGDAQGVVLLPGRTLVQIHGPDRCLG